MVRPAQILLSIVVLSRQSDIDRIIISSHQHLNLKIRKTRIDLKRMLSPHHLIRPQKYSRLSLRISTLHHISIFIDSNSGNVLIDQSVVDGPIPSEGEHLVETLDLLRLHLV